MFEFELIAGGFAPQPGGYPQAGGYPQGGGYPPQGGQSYQPQAAPQVAAPKRFFLIVSQMNGKVMDIKDNKNAPDVPIVMWSKNQNAKNQQWYTDQQGNIRSALNDFAFTSASEGAPLKMAQFTGDPKQQWYVEGQKLMNRSGVCADIKGKSNNDGAEVISWKYNGGNNQHWTLQYV